MTSQGKKAIFDKLQNDDVIKCTLCLLHTACKDRKYSHLNFLSRNSGMKTCKKVPKFLLYKLG